MRVSIDAGRCQGHGRCFTGAPTVFGFDDLGNGVVLVTEPNGEDVALARLAEANCPEHAVEVRE